MRPKILVVDDDPHILQTLQMRLESLGYDSLTASDGKSSERSSPTRLNSEPQIKTPPGIGRRLDSVVQRSLDDTLH